MLSLLEIAGGLFLLCYSYLPFQNVDQLTRMLLGSLVLWIFAAFVFRKKPVVSTSNFLSACLLIAYFSRATYADGWMTDWFFWMFLAAWCVVLLMTAAWPEDESAPLFFLCIFLISPLQLFILSALRSFPGIPIWSFAVLRLAFAHTKQKGEFRISAPVLIFIVLSLLAVPFSQYAWRAMQFFLINCICLLLYTVTADSIEFNRKPLSIAYACLVASFAIYLLPREIFVLEEVGSPVLAMRHFLVEHPNTLGPLLLVLSAILLHFFVESDTIAYKIISAGEIIFVGTLLFLTYSRSSWIGYLIFILVFTVLTIRRRLLIRNLIKVSIAGLILIFLVAAWSPVQTMLASRLKDYRSIDDRIHDMKIGLAAIGEHPIWGNGWFNYYVHAKFQKTSTTLEDIDSRTRRGAVHDHSMFLDITEAGGIPLGVAFVILHFAPLFHRAATRSLSAGLIGIAANNVFDTSCLWLTVYPHFWILLGLFGAGNFRAFKIPRNIFHAVLALLIFFASVFPAIEDHALQSAAFFRVENRPADARRALRIANWVAPFDAEPIEGQKGLDLDALNVTAALSTLETLTALKKDFPPYLVEQARLYFYQGNSQKAAELLNRAKELDPYTALMEDTYLFLSSQCRLQQDQSYCMHLLSLAFLHPLSPKNLLQSRTELQLFDEHVFLDRLIEFVNKNSAGRNRVDAIDIVYANLSQIGKNDLAAILLQKVLQQPEKLPDEDVDYFSELLARYFARSGRASEIRKLPHGTGAGARMNSAWLAIAEHRWTDVIQMRDQILEHSTYADTAELWRTLYEESNQPERLRTHVRILQRLPWLFRGQFEQELIARSYYEQSNFNSAAREFRKAALFDFTHPRAHWLASRCYILAGEVTDAQKENSIVSHSTDDQLLRNFYRFGIETSSINRAYLTREALPNEIGGESWRTCIFLHPPSAFVVPDGIKLRSVKTEIALLPGAWVENSDGVIFSILDESGKIVSSKKLDPSHVRNDQGWIRFESTITNPGQRLTFETRGGGTDDYDWAVWSFRNP